MTEILQVVIFGLLLGGVYALFASGLTLAFGVMRIVNLAHAVFIVAAAYVAFFAFDELGIDPLLSVLLIMPLFFVFSGVGLTWLKERVIAPTQWWQTKTSRVSFPAAAKVGRVPRSE